jgi:hypothetical protein
MSVRKRADRQDIPQHQRPLQPYIQSTPDLTKIAVPRDGQTSAPRDEMSLVTAGPEKKLTGGTSSSTPPTPLDPQHNCWTSFRRDLYQTGQQHERNDVEVRRT